MAQVEKLIEGYRKFYKKYFEADNTLYKELKEGQSPKTLIIACSDSRVDPSILMSAEPGDIFSVRNVANLVPPCEMDDDSLHGVSASLEFAVRVLEVENIIILGHSNCAGIAALLNSDTIEETDFIGKWMSVAADAKKNTLAKASNSDEEIQHICEKEGILLSLGNLVSFPWIKSRVESGKLKLHGWYFCLEEGIVSRYNPESDKFESLLYSIF